MTPSSEMRELNISEINSVAGGAAPGQGHDPVPPPGTRPQPINPGQIVSTELGAIAAVPGQVPGLI